MKRLSSIGIIGIVALLVGGQALAAGPRAAHRAPRRQVQDRPMAAPTALLGELREIRGVIAAVLPGADPALQRALRHLDRRAARLERLALLRPRLAGLLGRRVAQLRGALAALLSGDGSGGFSGGTEIPGRDKDSS